MSHADDVYDHEIKKHDPAEGFDRSEPNVPAVWAFTVASFVLLILVIVAVQFYFQEIFNKAVQDKVLAAPSEQLQSVRNRDAWNATHYMYGDMDKKSGRVRVPVDKAMEMFADEAQAGKLFYPAKPAAPKKDDLPAPAGAVAAAATTPALEKK
jgi:hypothetical protein